jgi:hypothetical protein
MDTERPSAAKKTKPQELGLTKAVQRPISLALRVREIAMSYIVRPWRAYE